jgi:hypothetical protein
MSETEHEQNLTGSFEAHTESPQDGSQSRDAADRAEFEQFKSDRDRKAAEKQAAAEKRDNPDEWTHYVHLADGRVIKHNMTEPLGSAFEEDAESGDEDAEPTRTQIIGVFPR